MKRSWVIISVGALMAISLLGCEGSKEEEKPKTITDTKQLIEVKCTACHFSSRIFDKPRKKEAWKDIVQRMRARNVNIISEEEAERITKYLEANNSISEEQLEKERIAREKERETVEQDDLDLADIPLPE